MKKYSALLACLLGLGLFSTALTKPITTPEVSRERIEQLAKQLGAERFADREEAQKELERIGTPALEVLRKTAKDADLEVSRRAGEIIRRLEERTFTQNVLTPKKVKLSFKDTPVPDAVADLAKQSGYAVEVEGNLKDRKITLETGEVTFWEGLDQLCAKGNLVEKQVAASPINPFGPNLFQLPGNPGLLPLQPFPIPMGGFQFPMLPGVDPAQPKKQAEEQLKKQLEQLEKQKKQLEEQLKKLQQGGEAAPAQPFPKGAVQAVPADMMKAMEAQMQVRMKAMEAQMQVCMKDMEQHMQAQMKQIRAQMQAQLQLQLQQIQLQQIQPGGVPGFPGASILPGMPNGLPGFPGQPFAQPFGQPGLFLNPFAPLANQGNPQKIVLIDGKPLSVPTSYAGAVRIRLLPSSSVNMQPKQGEMLLVFDLSAEPRLPVFRPQGKPIFAKTRDDQGQNLTTIEDQAGAAPMMMVVQQRQIVVHLKLGQKKAEVVKELTGTISAEVQLPPEPVINIENVLQAKGQTVKGKNGATLTLKSVEKVGDVYCVEYSQEVAANPAGGVAGIQIQVGPFGIPGMPAAGNQEVPNLLDAQGNKYQIAKSTSNFEFANGAGKKTFTIEYRADAGQGEPTRLVLTEARLATVAVPFDFKDVKLP